MFWILTRQEARDNWLLTGWRKGSFDDPDVKITPYIEFDDGAQLKEFLRLNNHPVYSSQISTHNWLISNGLPFHAGLDESSRTTLLGVLKLAHEDVYDLHCPSVKREGDEWTHCERCMELRDLINSLELLKESGKK